MEIALNNVFTVSVPEKDRAFFRSMARHMGWRTKLVRKEKKSGLELALEDVKAGRVHHAASVEDFFNQLNAD